MTISSRTPEGLPHRCPVCGNPSATEPSFPGGDSCCPSCGHLLWWFRDRLASDLGIAPDMVILTSTFADDLRVNSLDTVELVMALEEEFNLSIPDEDAEKIETVADAIRYIERRRREGGKPEPDRA